MATISSTGLATGVSPGTANISANIQGPFGTVVGTSNITVTAGAAGSSGRILTSLTLTPPSQTVIATGETAQYIAIGTYSSSPLTVDITAQVAWQSSDVKVGQVNASGLVTGIGLGSATITALATASDTSVISATSTFAETSPPGPPGPVNLPTLTIYKVGNGTGTVMGGTGIAAGMITGTVVIDCGSGTGCIGTFPVATKVASTIPSNNSVFDGWSNNCTPTDANGNTSPASPATSPYCTVTTTNTHNYTVGAIFDPITP